MNGSRRLEGAMAADEGPGTTAVHKSGLLLLVDVAKLLGASQVRPFAFAGSSFCA